MTEWLRPTFGRTLSRIAHTHSVAIATESAMTSYITMMIQLAPVLSLIQLKHALYRTGRVQRSCKLAVDGWRRPLLVATAAASLPHRSHSSLIGWSDKNETRTHCACPLLTSPIRRGRTVPLPCSDSYWPVTDLHNLTHGDMYNRITGKIVE